MIRVHQVFYQSASLRAANLCFSLYVVYVFSSTLSPLLFLIMSFNYSHNQDYFLAVNHHISVTSSPLCSLSGVIKSYSLSCSAKEMKCSNMFPLQFDDEETVTAGIFEI